LLLGFLASAAACSGSGARDVVPPSRDVVTSADAPRRPSDPNAAYEYVARRPGAVVALAEARGLPAELARAAIDHVADALASCAEQRRRAGVPADGAARIIAQIEPTGIVGAASLRVDPGRPGQGAAESAVLCFAAPVKALVFDPVDAHAAGATTARGLAIEALWGVVPAGLTPASP
jgi:hypothetical protein